MDKKSKEDLCLYRLEKAKNTYKSAQVLFEIEDYSGANNRAYYAIFYAIRAVLALERVDFKKHKDVIAYFNQYYVNTEIFPKKMGRKISQAQYAREKSDYEDGYIVSNDKAKEQLDSAKELIELVEEYLNKIT